MQERSGDADQPAMGWLFLDPELVPERWRTRIRPAAVVPLLPEEAARVLEGKSAAKVTELGDDEFLTLVAKGSPARTISRKLGISTRSVHRRLARLREALEVESTLELAAELSRRGF